MNDTGLSKIKDHEQIPVFTLPSALNWQISSSNYKQKKNLVIFFAHDLSCEQSHDLVISLNNNIDRYRYLNSEVLFITADDVYEQKNLIQVMEISYPLLSDPGFEAKSKYIKNNLGRAVAVFVVDKFGELFEHHIEKDELDLPSQNDIFDTLKLIENQCPECGV